MKKNNLIFILLGGAVIYLLYDKFKNKKTVTDGSNEVKNGTIDTGTIDTGTEDTGTGDTGTGDTGTGDTGTTPPFVVVSPNDPYILRLKKMAWDLFTAMDGCGTDEDKIKQVLNQVGDKDGGGASFAERDFTNLIKIYGTKTISCGRIPTKGTLLQHLCSENNGGWFNVGETVTELNNILKSKGVTTLIPLNC